MSHGHLSKVERGEPGRPVTPAVLAAYEKVTGMRLTGIAGHSPTDTGGDWRRGHLSDARRRTLNAKIAAVAVGGPLGEQVGRILDSTGRILAPVHVEEPDVAAVEKAAAMCTDLDLRHGGGVADQQARALLRWAIGLLASETTGHIHTQLLAAVAAIAQRAGWAAFDADSHDVARSLLTIALYAATQADHPDLRAHVLADLAAQHNYLGYPTDCLKVVRLGEVDERIGPHLRFVLNTVKARAYAAQGDTDACHHHLNLATQAQAQAAAATSQATGWLATTATPAQLAAATGHALATLARRTDSTTARTEAQQHLTHAAEQLGPHQRRATALCLVQLATLHLQAGQLDHGLTHAHHALNTTAGIRSARLTAHLAALRTAATAHHHEPELAHLVTTIDTPPTHNPTHQPA